MARAAEDDDVGTYGRRVVSGVVRRQILRGAAPRATGARTFGSFGDEPPPVLRPGALLLLASQAASDLTLGVVRYMPMTRSDGLPAGRADAHSEHVLYIDGGEHVQSAGVFLAAS